MSQSATSVDDHLPAERPRWLPVARIGDQLARLLCKGAAFAIVLLAILLVVVLVHQSWLSISTNGIGFFTTKVWAPQEDHRAFGSLAFVYGTVASSALAMLIAVPLGVGTAAFLSEVAPEWLRRGGS